MKDCKGFTLVEVLIVVSLIAVVGLLMYSFFGQGLNLYAKESESAEEQANMRQVLSDITNKVRLADASTVNYTSGTLNIGSFAYKLENKSIKRNGTVIANDISVFEVTFSEGILEINIVHKSGRSLSTSISLN